MRWNDGAMTQLHHFNIAPSHRVIAPSYCQYQRTTEMALLGLHRHAVDVCLAVYASHDFATRSASCGYTGTRSRYRTETQLGTCSSSECSKSQTDSETCISPCVHRTATGSGCVCPATYTGRCCDIAVTTTPATVPMKRVNLHKRNGDKLFTPDRPRAKTDVTLVFIREMLFADDVEPTTHTEEDRERLTDQLAEDFD
ncbi:hypothetical protein LSAT2_010508 [Lamellibrachia satsuma]|nr:hypothetical protein LSAT2_010508 [Lamellibrachia satsuma]